MSIKKPDQLFSKKNSALTDITAGIIGYFTTVYIVVVNGSILSEAGISLESGMIATVLASFFGCMIMGILGNAPLILIPGMGVNALFAYSIVETNGFTFHQGLGVVLIASVLFMVTAFTPIGPWLKQAIPDSLKHAITVGLGFFLILIGLEKGGLVVKGEHSLISLGNLSSPTVIVSLLTLLIGILLFVRNVPGNFLITMVAGTAIAYLFGIVDVDQAEFSSTGEQIFFLPSFSAAGDLSFWMAVFPLTIVLIFENMGLIHGQLNMLNQHGKFARAYRASAFSSLTCAFFGTSPTVSSAESSAVIASKGKSGKAALTTGLLFLLTFLFIPWITIIPGTAITPILIIVGMLMAQNVRHISLDDLSETLPAFLLIIMIPFTYSIADGMAFGFIAYPAVKFAAGKRKELSIPLLAITSLFIFDFVMKILV